MRGLARTYADVDPGDPLVLVGSSGFVEIAVRDGDAAALLGLACGTPVSFGFTDEGRAARTPEAHALPDRARP